MKEEPSMLATFCLAVAAALALSFLLAGCASSRPDSSPPTAAGWGACDHSRMVRVMLVCWETKPEPVSELSR